MEVILLERHLATKPLYSQDLDLIGITGDEIQIRGGISIFVHHHLLDKHQNSNNGIQLDHLQNLMLSFLIQIQKLYVPTGGLPNAGFTV